MSRAGSEERSGWLFVLPFTISMTLFFVYAIVRTAYYSFTDFDLFKAPVFVGLSNYTALVSDELFLIALRNTIGFSLIVTTVQSMLALALAVLVNHAVRARGLIRTVFYLPSIMSSAAMTLIFLWLFQRDGLMTAIVSVVLAYRGHILLFFMGLVALQGALVLNARRSYEGISILDPFFLLAAAFGALTLVVTCALAGLLPVFDNDLLISWLNTQQHFLFMPVTLWSVALMNVFTTVPTLMLLFLAGATVDPERLVRRSRDRRGQRFPAISPHNRAGAQAGDLRRRYDGRYRYPADVRPGRYSGRCGAAGKSSDACLLRL
jgi:multiple sugar transport system permease protein